MRQFSLYRSSSGRNTPVRTVCSTVLVCLSCLLAHPTAALGAGKITGTVVDAATGDPLPGVNVFLIGTSIGSVTDFAGNYTILNVPPGTYQMQFSMISYARLIVDNVRVNTDFTTHQNAQLSEETIQGEEIVVVAERPLIVKDQTSSVSIVTGAELAVLPIDDFSEAARLQPGVVRDASGGLHIRGGRANEIAYIVDGIVVTDPYSGSIAVPVAVNAIEELAVVSGTFNAEFGQAQSGVINITTKNGSERYEGTFQAFVGTYLSGDDRYLNIDNVRPLSITDLQGSLSGPIPALSKLNFFLSGRVLSNEGYIWGQRWFNPSDDSDFSSPDAADWVVVSTGDSANVSLNRRADYSAQGKLIYRPFSGATVSLSGIFDRGDFREYDHDFKYNPDGDYVNKRTGRTFIFNWNHLLSPTTFYVLRAAQVFTERNRFVFEDPLDSRYAIPALLERPPLNFASGGTKADHLNRSTQTNTLKAELTSQITRVHLVKGGLEARLHDLKFQSFLVVVDEETGIPSIDPEVQGPFGRDEYRIKPIELSAYVQDKIEMDEMIVNIGFRLDYFDSKYVVPSDLRDPTNSTKVDSESKIQVSPRVGVAYPISDSGVIHFSYGHFFQVPPFQFLYSNPEFEIKTGGLNSIVGNANLEPEQTIAYEFGLQQQLSRIVVIEVVGFYKDIRNLLGTEIFRTGQQTRYARYTNRDFGNVKGITVSVEQRRRRGDLLGIGVNYTFSVAEGVASDPDAVFLDNVSVPPLESESQLVFLDWDQRHTINAIVNIGQGSWDVGLIGRMASGQPYTPTPFGRRTTAFPENSENRPPTFSLDLQASWSVATGAADISLFLKAFNLFDRRNPIDVYSDTGKPGTTIIRGRDERPVVISTLDDFINRRNFYAPPREIRAGVGIRF